MKQTDQDEKPSPVRIKTCSRRHGCTSRSACLACDSGCIDKENLQPSKRVAEEEKAVFSKRGLDVDLEGKLQSLCGSSE